MLNKKIYSNGDACWMINNNSVISFERCQIYPKYTTELDLYKKT